MWKGCLIILASISVSACSEFKALYATMLSTEDADAKLADECTCTNQSQQRLILPMPIESTLPTVTKPINTPQLSHTPIKKQTARPSHKANTNMSMYADDTKEGKHRLLTFPANYYTLQLAAFSSRERLSKVYQRYHLPDLMKVETYNGRQTMHVLIYGVYSSKEQAMAAKENVPYQLSPKPWIRKIGPLQQALEDPY